MLDQQVSTSDTQIFTWRALNVPPSIFNTMN